MKRFKLGKLMLDEKCLKDNLGSGNFIFVGSSVDMFADEIPDEWIKSVLTHCIANPNNTYLFQSKNPKRFEWYYKHSWFPTNFILGTTIESNRLYPESNAPSVDERRRWMILIRGKIMVSIEPILDFDLDIMVDWIKEINPKFVSIGADSKNYGLKEPSEDKIIQLIHSFKKFTQVKVKNNLYRLCPNFKNDANK